MNILKFILGLVASFALLLVPLWADATGPITCAEFATTPGGKVSTCVVTFDVPPGSICDGTLTSFWPIDDVNQCANFAPFNPIPGGTLRPFPSLALWNWNAQVINTATGTASPVASKYDAELILNYIAHFQ